MNELIYLIYAVDVLSKVAELAEAALALICVAALLAAILLPLFLDLRDLYFEDIKHYIPKKTIISTLVLSLFLLIVIPSKQSMYTMLAVKVGGDVANELNVGGVTRKAMTLLEQKIDEQLAEGKK